MHFKAGQVPGVISQPGLRPGLPSHFPRELGTLQPLVRDQGPALTGSSQGKGDPGAAPRLMCQAELPKHPGSAVKQRRWEWEEASPSRKSPGGPWCVQGGAERMGGSVAGCRWEMMALGSAHPSCLPAGHFLGSACCATSPGQAVTPQVLPSPGSCPDLCVFPVVTANPSQKPAEGGFGSGSLFPALSPAVLVLMTRDTSPGCAFLSSRQTPAGLGDSRVHPGRRRGQPEPQPNPVMIFWLFHPLQIPVTSMKEVPEEAAEVPLLS